MNDATTSDHIDLDAFTRMMADKLPEQREAIVDILVGKPLGIRKVPVNPATRRAVDGV